MSAALAFGFVALAIFAAGFAVIWCHWVGALNRLERVETRARELAADSYTLSTQVERMSKELEEADAPLATIHHLPQVQRVAEVLAANEAKRHLTDERLNEVTEEWGPA